MISVAMTSAQKHGLLCEVDSDDEDKELCEPFFAHCKAHSVKEVTKRKVSLCLRVAIPHVMQCVLYKPACCFKVAGK